MSGHLLLVTLGPVQEFIAQARRTRDLWFGSHLLSEVSRAAARGAADAGAELVYPALPKGDPELVSCLEPVRTTGLPPRNVSNKILCVVPPGRDPRAVALAARAEARRFWKEDVVLPVWKRMSSAGLLAPGIDKAWNEQVDTFLEFLAAWEVLGDADYPAVHQRLDRTITGRKGLRDFHPWDHQREWAPKSSLDGARCSVLAEDRAGKARGTLRRYRIPEGEQLDAVGLVKRAGGNPEQFVPIVNVALAAWIDKAGLKAPEPMERLRVAARELAGQGQAVTRDVPWVRRFPWNGDLLLPERWKDLFDQDETGERGREWGLAHARPVLDRMPEPCPYVACLVADGDRVGTVLSSLTTAGQQRRFSARLAEFASMAREIVEVRHRGALVYCGGDDVLAFVTLVDAVPCARSLADAFRTLMETALPPDVESVPPTLSVGLGIGHLHESLGDLLELGRAAEKLAKGNGLPPEESRNALGIVLQKRSGGQSAWRGRWETDPAQRLATDVELLDRAVGGLPSSKISELRRDLDRMPSPGHPETREGEAQESWARLLRQDAWRTLSRAEGGTALDRKEIGLDLDEGDYGQLHRRIRNWIERMLIARVLVDARARGEVRT